jgi:hypothetical protein
VVDSATGQTRRLLFWSLALAVVLAFIPFNGTVVSFNLAVPALESALRLKFIFHWDRRWREIEFGISGTGGCFAALADPSSQWEVAQSRSLVEGRPGFWRIWRSFKLDICWQLALDAVPRFKLLLTPVWLPTPFVFSSCALTTRFRDINRTERAETLEPVEDFVRDLAVVTPR